MSKLNIRPATFKDCEDIWKWRNDPGVRKFSFSQSEIPLNDHRVWFNKKLASEDTVMFVFENEQGAKVGGARFDILGQDTAFISVNMNPEYIGQGLGTQVVLEATKTFFKQRPAVASVLAEVLDVNVRSLKVFEKAGYVRQGQSIKQGQAIYTLRTDSSWKRSM